MASVKEITRPQDLVLPCYGKESSKKCAAFMFVVVDS